MNLKLAALGLVALGSITAVGNWLTRQEYKTSAVGTYFVDPTGNDANACTASGTAACATLSGAFAKLPPRVLHAQTFNVAAGTYTDAVVLNDLDINAAITVVGPALANVTPATGSATGALTTVANTNPAVMTDSGQTWTTNNLVGQWLVMTSGAQNGQLRIIATNTATTVTLASPFTTAPATSDTYAIRSPAAVITTSTGVALAVRAIGNSGGNGASGVTFGITGLSFRNTGSNLAACRVSMANQTLSLTNSSCVTTSGTAGTALVLTDGALTLSNSAVVGTGLGMTASLRSPGSLNPNNSFVYGAAASGILMSSPIANLGLNGSVTWTVQTGSASASDAAFTMGITNRTGTSAAYMNLRCLQSGPSGLLAVAPLQLVYDNVHATGCTTGINLSAANGVAPSNVGVIGTELACVNTTTCINVAAGSRVRVPATFTLTGVTNDITIDGVNFTKANLTGASPTRLPTTAGITGSSVWQ